MRGDDLRWRAPFQKVLGMQQREQLHLGIDCSGRSPRQSEAAAFELYHVLEPGLRPPTNGNIPCHWSTIGDERRKSSTIADTQQHDARRVDPAVRSQRSECGAISRELRLKIGPTAVAFTVADAR